MHNKIISSILVVPLILMTLTANAEKTVATPLALYNQLSTCKSLTDPITYSKDSAQLILAANPQGYCMLTIKKDQTSPPVTCYLSEQDVKLMTSPDAQNAAIQAQHSNTINPGDLLTYFYPLAACANQVLPSAGPLVLPEGARFEIN